MAPGALAQRSEQATHNRLVPGSNPGGPTSLTKPPFAEGDRDALRAWLVFLGFSFHRQARARVMVWLSLLLLGLVALLVHLNTRFDRWNMAHWRVTVRLPES